MDSKSKFYVAGNTGLVGSAIVRMLKKKRFYNIISSPSSHWDLTVQNRVEQFFRINQPEYVFLAAAKVGGIGANSESPAHFIYDNLMIQTNIIDCAYRYGAKKLIFLGSSCIYPKFANQPIKEEELMTGALEPSNDAYATAKIAGIKMCQAYRQQYGFNAISVMPTNLYGPNDNYDLEKSHVTGATITKVMTSKDGLVNVWGTGEEARDLLYIEDFISFIEAALNKQKNNYELYNVGLGQAIKIKHLVQKVIECSGRDLTIRHDLSKPTVPTSLFLDCTKAKNELGWAPDHTLDEGLNKTIEWYKNE